MTKHVAPKKLGKAIALTRSERRAANTDVWVKNHLSEARDAENRNRQRLKALREARDTTLPAVEQTPGSDPAED